MRTESKDPPTHIRWTSVRLAEPLHLRRPWWRPRLERQDGTALPTDTDGNRMAEGSDGAPVRVGAAFSFLQLGLLLQVDGRPVPATAPVSRSVGLGVLAALFCLAVLGGYPSAGLGYLVCCTTIAVGRCEGDRATRRRQARAVAIAGGVLVVAVVALGALLLRALDVSAGLWLGLAGASW